MNYRIKLLLFTLVFFFLMLGLQACNASPKEEIQYRTFGTAVFYKNSEDGHYFLGDYVIYERVGNGYYVLTSNFFQGEMTIFSYRHFQVAFEDEKVMDCRNLTQLICTMSDDSAAPESSIFYRSLLRIQKVEATNEPPIMLEAIVILVVLLIVGIFQGVLVFSKDRYHRFLQVINMHKFYHSDPEGLYLDWKYFILIASFVATIIGFSALTYLFFF